MELWGRLTTALVGAMPDAVLSEDERSRSLVDGGAVELLMFPGEISLSAPYWFDGDEASGILNRMKDIAREVEAVTGLVAYDPQADAAFLDAGVAVGAASFEQVHQHQQTSSSRRRWPFGRRS